MVNTNSNDMIDFSASVRNFAERKICLQPQRLQIHLPNAKEVVDRQQRTWAVLHGQLR